MTKSSSLIGITYSEFDNFLGPKLTYCFPENVLMINGKDEFEASFSDYAIVGNHLCEKIISIKTNDVQYMNYSTSLHNPKYFRNTLLFSFGLVLTHDTDLTPYERILKKISASFVAAEMESEFLFQSDKKAQLPELLQQIYDQLRYTGEAFVQIDASNFITLKLYLSFTYPPDVHDYDVPMLLFDKYALSSLPWDLTIRHLLPRIDGTSNAKQIALDVDMDLDRVKRSIRLLLHYQCIIIADVFKFSNVYELLPKGISELGKQTSYELLEQTLCFCIKSSGKEKIFHPNDENHTMIMKSKYYNLIIMLLYSFRYRKRIHQLRDEFQRLSEEIHDINIRRLLAYAQHMGWIRRVHEYPCYTLPRTQPSPQPQSQNHHNYNISSIHSNSKNQHASYSSSPNLMTMMLKRTPSMLKQARHRSGSLSSDDMIQHMIDEEKVASQLRMVDHIESLTGERCLDDICCDYAIKAHDILDYAGIVIIYK